MRLIDVDILITRLQKFYDKKAKEAKYTGSQVINVTWNDAICYIKSAPIIDSQYKKGKWIFEEYPDGYYHSECSECKHHFIEDAYLKPYNFCPNCGTDMRGENNG